MLDRRTLARTVDILENHLGYLAHCVAQLRAANDGDKPPVRMGDHDPCADQEALVVATALVQASAQAALSVAELAHQTAQLLLMECRAQ